LRSAIVGCDGPVKIKLDRVDIEASTDPVVITDAGGRQKTQTKEEIAGGEE